MNFKLLLASALVFSASAAGAAEADYSGFVKVSGPDLVKPDGSKLFIMGTNLGNWLNPEGYMFNFRRTNSPRMINDMFCELVGPDATAEFWEQFKENYITKADIDFIAAQGANTIRLPFHYKLFTDEDYMGETANQKGFDYIDKVVSWARNNGLYVILDMHDAPGGQTGDNIDDSYGYPWLLTSERSQKQFCDIWKEIAKRYKDETAILGYELINEPIAHYFEDKDSLNALLQPLHMRAVSAIREADPNHIILLGGPQWNSVFTPLTNWTYDNNLMWTCHRYGGDVTAEAISHYIETRDRSNLPMYMGEIGHNTDKWQADFARVMKENNIGYTFWPYKKAGGSCMNGVKMPEGWDIIVEFSEAPRGTYEEIRNARPSGARLDSVKTAMKTYLENIKAANCEPQTSYIESMLLNEPQPKAKAKTKNGKRK